MSNEKENPNDAKPKIIPFDKWVESLELEEAKVSCEACAGDGGYECEACAGDGEYECQECCGSGLMSECDECDDEGGHYDEYPGIESTGWVVCEYCHGHPLRKCDECCGDGVVECEECWGSGLVGECDECGGSGVVIEYSPRDEDHLEELADLGVFLLGGCDYDDLVSAYKQERVKEDKLMAERGKVGDLK